MPTLELDYDRWLTKQQVAEQLGCSTKTVEAFAKENRLRSIPDFKRATGGARIAIFHPEDVTRLAADRQAGTLTPAIAPPPLAVGRVVPANGSSPSVALQPYTPPPSVTPWLDAFMAALEKSQNHSQKQSQISDLALKLYLTIPEAARLSGFTEARIRRQCQDGTLKAVKDGGWKIRRADLLAL